MNMALIGLGSNINSSQDIEKAVKNLSRNFETIGTSKFRETKPFGFKEQANFINDCIQIKTKLKLAGFQKNLKEIEKQLSQTSSRIKFGPKVIDLDVVVWNIEIIDQDFFERGYLKSLVLELLPNLVY